MKNKRADPSGEESARDHWSGREDLNLRHPAPKAKSGLLLKHVAGGCLQLLCIEHFAKRHLSFVDASGTRVQARTTESSTSRLSLWFEPNGAKREFGGASTLELRRFCFFSRPGGSRAVRGTCACRAGSHRCVRAGRHDGLQVDVPETHGPGDRTHRRGQWRPGVGLSHQSAPIRNGSDVGGRLEGLPRTGIPVSGTVSVIDTPSVKGFDTPYNYGRPILQRHTSFESVLQLTGR